MKLLSIFFSFLVLVTLLPSFISDNEEISASNSITNGKKVELPKLLSKKYSETDNKWLAIVAENQQASVSKEVLNKEEKDKSLVIGEQRFKLYGVFADGDKPFVLLKPENTDLKKVYVNDFLSNGIQLTTVQSNKVTFKKNKETFEFKLFERNKNE